MVLISILQIVLSLISHGQLHHRLKVEFHLPKWPLLPLANAFLKVT